MLASPGYGGYLRIMPRAREQRLGALAHRGNGKNFGASLDRLGHPAGKSNGTRVRKGLVVGTSGRPFDDGSDGGPAGGTGSHRVASETRGPVCDPAESRIGMPRRPLQGRIGSDDPKSFLDSESIKGADIGRAMETCDPVRPCNDKTPANGRIPTGSHPDDASGPATLPDIERVAECLARRERATVGDIVRSTGLDMMVAMRAAGALVRDGRASLDRGGYVWADPDGLGPM